ncbi:cell division protein FtsK [Eikenella sp. S3360]|uniref:Cell division protein FtsK n=1 Tax=Eikenella glucosivorans TaxID=2766967 RepID=A0ABS0NAS7_9NEIS|nr:DNA translocase FtsK [Eikenella glucosivorans]MBH5329414.1 cell division protein FtsK [Eikenella glucosivorans]
MFLAILLILLLAGIAGLLWWRAREEREWLLELTYLNRHQGNKEQPESTEEIPPQQPARPNVLPQRAQTQVKLHYQKVQDELRQKIEQLTVGSRKKARRRNVSENQEELPIFSPEEANLIAEDEAAAAAPGQSVQAEAPETAIESPTSQTEQAETATEKPQAEQVETLNLSDPAADLPVITEAEATRHRLPENPEQPSEEPVVISLSEATRMLHKQESAEAKPLETVVLNWPIKAPTHAETPREEITPADPALQYVREKIQAHLPTEPQPPATKTAETPHTISPDDIRNNLLRQRLRARRQPGQTAEPVTAPQQLDLAVIGEDEILANLAKTDAPANRQRNRFKRQTVRESVIPAAARVSHSQGAKMPVWPPQSSLAPISTRFTPFEPAAGPEEQPNPPAEEESAVPTEPQNIFPEQTLSDHPPPWLIGNRSAGQAEPAEVAPEQTTGTAEPNAGYHFRPDYSLAEQAPAADNSIEFDNGNEWQQALEQGAAEAAWQNQPAAPTIPPLPDLPPTPTPVSAVPAVSFADFGHYHVPMNELLLPPQHDSNAILSEEQLLENSIKIEEKLAEFRVKVNVVDAYAGPVITRYEIEPDVGVRGNSVINLEKDLARSLGVAAIRVVETIPGKTCMGLELPNPKRQMIRLSEVFNSPVFAESKSKLTLALGQDITGEPVVTDLAKAPHLLVAGTTGSGKSVGVNAMILSLLFKATPDEVRLIMIDPKMLELSVYEGIPHLLAPVVTDMKLAANALTWCVNEMEKRYRLMSHVGVRNLAGYNQKIKEASERGEHLANPFSLTPDNPELLTRLPSIVVVVDEFADLMMTSGKKIEELIARLAQKARAAGIHLILATQRPSVDVITGLIKANIPTRIAFQVASKVDSRTILDQMGAENLLGQGDMLFLPPGTGYPQRVHGAFVADSEVQRVAEYLKGFGAPDYVEDILTSGVGSDDLFSNANSGIGGSTKDPLFDEAVAIVLRTQKATISSIQRHLRIGYNKAATLVDQMEAEGIVSAADTNGKRTILARSDHLDD